MKIKISVTFLFLLGFYVTTYCQNGYVPDDNFEQALIDLGYDTGPLDDSVAISEVEGIVELDLVALGIADLTGIKYFYALSRLDCSLNSLTTLDFTNNVQLEELNCELNALNSINVSENNMLKSLAFGYNEVTSIDLTNNFLLETLSFVGNSITTLNLYENTELLTLICTGNTLLGLDLGGNPNLELLECHATGISSLDLSANESLKTLICGFNVLDNLDLTNNEALIYLNCEANELTELDLSHTPLLEKIYLGFNNLGELNLTSNTELQTVDVRSNELTYLDMRNGVNTLIDVFRASENPLLTCIDVDNVDWSTANWTEIDADANFSHDCNLSLPEFTTAFSVYPNPFTELVYLQSQVAFNYEIYSITGDLVLNGAGNSSVELNIGHLPNGVYVLSLFNENNRNMIRLIKE